MVRLQILSVRLLLAVALVMLTGVQLLGGEHEKQKKPAPVGLFKTTVQDAGATILINAILSRYRNNGEGSYNAAAGISGFEYPKGSGLTAIYSDGLVWGGKHRDVVKVGGSTYQHGLQAGRIILPGTPLAPPMADNPILDRYRVYRVRPDIRPSTPIDDVRGLLDDEVTLLSRYAPVTVEGVYAAYILDWMEWPALEGAPFHDADANGVYDPLVDIPGVPGADQSLWHVSNDLDTSRTRSLGGSDPIGIELQRTIWAYRTTGALGSAVFVQYRLINLSGHAIDSMYVSQWSDPDMGDPSDDFAGCDTNLSLGYGYNADEFDALYGATPPAIGYDFFQGPIVPASPTDSAIFKGVRRGGWRNLPMTSFVYFASGGVYGDPPLGSIEGTRQWYNLMKGRIGATGGEYIDPTTGLPTVYMLSGDPIERKGWIDGIPTGPSDRRLVLSSGPFTMADGDTQEVVVATLAARGGDRLSSFALLRFNDRFAQMMYDSRFTVAVPEFSLEVTYPDAATAVAHVEARGGVPVPDSIRIVFRGNDDVAIDSADLYDDGAHGDGGIGDGVFGGSVTVARQQRGMHADARVVADGNAYVAPRVLESVTTAGDLELQMLTITSDNLNNDGLLNPGENIRYNFRVLNAGAFHLTALTITPLGADAGTYWEFTELASGTDAGKEYQADDASSYFAFTLDPSTADTIATVLVVTRDTVANLWLDTLKFSIHPFPVRPYGTPVPRIGGSGLWTFNAFVVDRTALTDHLYEMAIDDDEGARVLTLRDVSTGDTLFAMHPLPDPYGHNMPVTHGFKILRGQVWGVEGLDKERTAYLSDHPAWLFGSRFVQDPHSAFNGGVTTGYQLGAWPYLGQFASNFPHALSRTVEVRFDADAPQKAYRLRRTGPSTEYQLQTSTLPAAPGGEPFVDVPFQVWDVSDPDSPRQLTVSWRDQNDNALWDPPVGTNDGVEIVFIHFRPYDPLGRQFTYPANPDRPGDVVNNELTVGAEADIMYGLSLGVVTGHVLNEAPGTLLVVPVISLESSDRFAFRTTVPPPAPALTWPGPATVGVPYRPLLFWEVAEGADAYLLQVAREDTLFSEPLFYEGTTSATNSPTDPMGESWLVLERGVRYFWRVKAMNPYGSSPWAEPLNFLVDPGGLPAFWRYTGQTGRNATIAIPASIEPQLGPRPFDPGDVLGAFFRRNDSLICGGSVPWIPGSSAVLTVWGDDEETAEKDGFSEGEPMTFRVWDVSTARMHPVDVTFAQGGTSYMTDGIYVLNSVYGNTTVRHGVALEGGWNMVSSFLHPVDGVLASVLGEIGSSVVLLKNSKGEVYWPAFDINTIGAWQPVDGYQLYLTAVDTLWFSGEEVQPTWTPVPLRKGWNMVSYLRNEPSGADTAWVTIRNAIVVAKDNVGGVYLPSMGINTLGPLAPGHGYKIYMSVAAALRYPGNTSFMRQYPVSARALCDPSGRPRPTRFCSSQTPTGTSAIYVVEGASLQGGDEVALWDEDRRLVGSGVVHQGHALVVVCGDDPLTTEIMEGPRENDPLQLTVWSSIARAVRDDPECSAVDLLGHDSPANVLAYRDDGAWRVIVGAAGTVPTTFELSPNYPNPFNPVTWIRYGLPQTAPVLLEVYNLLGQKVAVLVEEDQKAGYHEAFFDAHSMSSGIYFYRLQAGGTTLTRKMILLK